MDNDITIRQATLEDLDLVTAMREDDLGGNPAPGRWDG